MGVPFAGVLIQCVNTHRLHCAYSPHKRNVAQQAQFKDISQGSSHSPIGSYLLHRTLASNAPNKSHEKVPVSYPPPSRPDHAGSLEGNREKD